MTPSRERGSFPALEFRAVGHSYLPGSWVFRSVSAVVWPGESVALRGRSGSGKSTLISIAALLLRPTEGECLIAGESSSRGERDLCAVRSKHLGFVFQQSHLLDRQPVWRSVALPLAIRGVARSAARRRSIEALDRVGLGGLSGRHPGQLSGGQQHRVAVARALVAEPSVLIADEPTAGLDETTGDQVTELLLQLCRESGLALVLATHDQKLAGMADRRLQLVAGVLEDDSSGST